MAKPEVDDMIEHYEPAFDRVATGKVVELLDSQFIYEVHKLVEKGREKIPVDKTSTRMCMFDEKWSKISVNFENLSRGNNRVSNNLKETFYYNASLAQKLY